MLRRGGGAARLVGYVVPASDGLDAERILADLRTHLPAYMVPSALVALAAMPQTPNGKIDRRALPEPDTLTPETPYRAPESDTEEQLCQIWRTVLEVERVGLDDNFFHLGGHSLLAMQLLSRVREAFSVEMSVRSLFEAPTVSLLAERVEAAQEAEAPLTLAAITADDYEVGVL